MNPQLAAILIITIKDLIIDLSRPKEELPDEWKVKIEAELQAKADAGEEWLKKTLSSNAGTD